MTRPASLEEGIASNNPADAALRDAKSSRSVYAAGRRHKLLTCYNIAMHDTTCACMYVCRRRRDRDSHDPPRDEYLRPMVDTQGIKYRIGLNEDEVTEDIREEFEENQRESWAALKFAGKLLGAQNKSCGLRETQNS